MTMIIKYQKSTVSLNIHELFLRDKYYTLYFNILLFIWGEGGVKSPKNELNVHKNVKALFIFNLHTLCL